MAIASAQSSDAFVAKPSVASQVIRDWKDVALKYAAFHPRVPYDLVLAIIAYESGGDPSARNDERLKNDPSDDSVGLMQVSSKALADFNAAFRRSYTMADMLIPWKNVEAGVGFLSLRIMRWGDVATAIRAYNGGDGGIDLAATKLYESRVYQYWSLIRKFENVSTH